MSIQFANVENEYSKDSKLKPEDVENLKKWVEKQPHLPNITELQAILFLQSCYYNNEIAKKAIDTFFTIKTLCPELFGHRNPKQQNFLESLKTLVYPLSKMSPEGYSIIFIKVMDTNTENYVFTHQIRNFDMITILNLHEKGTAPGHLIAVDFHGIIFGHFTKFGILAVKKFLYYLQEAMPLRLKGIHTFNLPSFIDKVMDLMKPFVKKEQFDLIYLHANVESLTKYIPLECLPSDYGGQEESLIDLQEKNMKRLVDNAEFFINEEKMVINESLRPEKPKTVADIFGVEGTFKKLDID